MININKERKKKLLQKPSFLAEQIVLPVSGKGNAMLGKQKWGKSNLINEGT